MDRSFLSRPEVIAASRKFICVRLMTYEDPKEAEFLKSIWVGRSGDLENTLFVILAPDGKKPLVRPGRSPDRAFGDAETMAASMNRIAGEYETRKTSGSELPPLPLVANVRLALNVAACDSRPLLVLHFKDEARKAAEQKLNGLAWSNEFIGRFVYAVSSSPKELGMIEGAKEGVLIVNPDSYGLKGKVLHQISAEESAERIAEGLRQGLSRHQGGERKFGDHIRQGHSDGVFWETVTPVTDPWEKMARERNRPGK
jgi:hypothetical protein